MTHVLLPSSVDHMLALIRGGATLEDAASEIGMTGRTIYRRVKRDAALRDRLTDAQRVRDEAKIKPHGRTSMYSRGCRCDPCREAHRLYRTRRRATVRRDPIPPSVQHGKAATYGNWGCRCQPCKNAHRVQMQSDYRRRMSGPIPDGVQHGTTSTYNGWGCRCDPCRNASREYWRSRRGVA